MEFVTLRELKAFVDMSLEHGADPETTIKIVVNGRQTFMKDYYYHEISGVSIS